MFALCRTWKDKLNGLYLPLLFVIYHPSSQTPIDYHLLWLHTLSRPLPFRDCTNKERARPTNFTDDCLALEPGGWYRQLSCLHLFPPAPSAVRSCTSWVGQRVTGSQAMLVENTELMQAMEQMQADKSMAADKSMQANKPVQATEPAQANKLVQPT